MAMHGRTRDRVERGLARQTRVQNSTGSFRGRPGAHFGYLGWMDHIPEADRLKELLCEASYVVYSYETPIGFVAPNEEGDETRYVIEEPHSMTTAQHLMTLKYAWREYEDPIPQYARRKAEEKREERNRRARERRAVARRALPSAARTLSESEVAELMNRRIAAQESGDGFIAPTEDSQADTLARLLDPRYANPDWVPGRDREADAAAEARDIARVEREREGAWRP